MAKAFKFFINIVILLSSLSARAFLMSSDEPYYITRDGNYTFIYTQQDSYFVKDLIEKNRAFKKLYEKEFDWVLDDPPFLILASSRNQEANGFVTIYPTLFSAFYGGGAAAIDEFAATSWLYTLLAHESAHLYQISAKQPYSSLLKKIFGNAYPNLVFPFPYMIFPNAFIPTLMMEGNATFNENRFGNGGRLYNGIYRAIFLNLVADKKVNSRRFINEHLDWPYTQEKYLGGAYLNLYLAEKYGIEKVNSFFKLNSDHYINPFLLNRSFLDTFGLGFDEVFKDLNAQWADKAARIQRVDGKIIGQSITHGGLNRAKGKILFLTTNGKRRPDLIQVKANGSIKEDRMNLPMGEPFVIGNEVYVPSAQLVSATEIRYGLFGQGMKSLPHFYNKFVYDIQGKKTLYGDIPKSFVATHLYLDGKFIDIVHSSAMFLPNGSFVYFKQEGDIRKLILHRDGQAQVITSYRGYFGKIVDTLPNGDVYFVASTELGASLFRVSIEGVRGQAPIQRVLKADTIADARFLQPQLNGSGLLLVAEITSEGYVYKLTQLDQPQLASPDFYNYFFNNHETQNFLKDGGASALSSNIAPQSEPYSSVSAIRFNAINPLPMGTVANGDFVGGLTAEFSDPLQYHNISFTYFHDKGDTNSSSLFYANKKYFVNFDFGFIFEQDAVFADPEEKIVEARFNSYSGTFGIAVPIYRRSQVDLTLLSRYTYTYEDHIPKYDKDIEQEHSLLTQITTQRALNYSFAYDIHSYQGLTLGHEVLRDARHFKEQNVRYVGQVNLVEDLFWENYLSLGYHAVLSEARQGDIEISDSVLPEKSTIVKRFTEETSQQYVQVNKVSAGYKKALNLSYYFSSFPISLRRLAPFAIYQEFYGAKDRNDRLRTLFHEWFYGIEVEFLFVHKIPMRITFGEAKMNKQEGSAFSTLLTVDHKF